MIVGDAETTSGYRAFVWDSVNQMRDLNTLLTPGSNVRVGTCSTPTASTTPVTSSGTGPIRRRHTHAFLLAPTLPGDANLDGKVNINDLTIVLAHFGQSGMTWVTGDFNGDGKVDVNDLTIVLSNFGQSLSGSSAAGRLGRRARAGEPGPVIGRDCLGRVAVPAARLTLRPRAAKSRKIAGSCGKGLSVQGHQGD